MKKKDDIYYKQEYKLSFVLRKVLRQYLVKDIVDMIERYSVFIITYCDAYKTCDIDNIQKSYIFNEFICSCEMGVPDINLFLKYMAFKDNYDVCDIKKIAKYYNDESRHYKSKILEIYTIIELYSQVNWDDNEIGYFENALLDLIVLLRIAATTNYVPYKLFEFFYNIYKVNYIDKTAIISTDNFKPIYITLDFMLYILPYLYIGCYNLNKIVPNNCDLIFSVDIKNHSIQNCKSILINSLYQTFFI